MQIRIVKKVLDENYELANEVRERLQKMKCRMVNFMSSPGSGKTALLDGLIGEFKKNQKQVAVIEGDISTSFDAQRLQHHEVPIVLINTDRFGGDCHLAANVILAALDQLDEAIAAGAASPDFILLENVGNLVCPAEVDTGAHLNVVLLSVTEGEEKPLKYPLMFRKSHLAVINKIDLAAAVECDLALIEKNLKAVAPRIEILRTSAKSKEGIAELARRITDLVSQT